MIFFTHEQCVDWCDGGDYSIQVNDEPARAQHNEHVIRCGFPSSFTQLLSFSRVLEAAIQPRKDCLVWITDWGIWPSSENWHLYYRLRQGYGDNRLLHSAPGHFCLDYECAEVVSLIYMSILFGWDAHVLPTSSFAQAFISHDEFVDLAFSDKKQKSEVVKQMTGMGVKVGSRQA